MRLLAAVVVILALAGCGQPIGDAIEISHVHGLAYDASVDTLYVATHHGLARGVRDGGAWTWSYIGDPFDYMGFTQDANRSDTFYSSGHPDDPRIFGGVHLGLRRSTDAGVTWEQRSLKGEVDFHALTALHGGEGWLAGFWQGFTKVSRDGGLTWTNHTAPGAVIALGSAEGQLLAATSTGLYRTKDLAGFAAWERLAGPGTGVISSVAASRDGTNLLSGTGDGRTGATYRSGDAGATWTQLTHPALASAPGQVLFAFEQGDASHAFAALGDGTMLESTDAGVSWSKVR